MRVLESDLGRRRLLAAGGLLALNVIGRPAFAAAVQRKDASTVRAGGQNYAYRRFGARGQRPLLLLQRFRGTMNDWDPAFLGELARHRTLLAFDGAGVGGSGGRTPDDVALMSEQAATIVRALGHAQVDVLGWSMGGFVAQVLAAQQPDLVRKLVLLGTGPAGSPETPAPAERVFAVATKPEWTAQDRNYLFFTDNAASRRLGTASDARIAAANNGVLRIATTAATMKRQAAAITAFLQGGNGAFARLSSIQAPALIVVGDRDPFFPALGAALLHRELPHSRLSVWPFAGHAPHHQHPREIATLIANFLAE